MSRTAYPWPNRCGVSDRRIDHWIRQRWLAIDVPHPGSGNARQLDRDTLRVACTIGELTDAGIATSVAAPIANAYVHDHQIRFEIAPDIWLLLADTTRDPAVS